MKDNFFEMLLNLFEQTLTQLKEKHESMTDDDRSHDRSDADSDFSHLETGTAFLKPAHLDSMRVFTDTETIKLTKASYQFLMRIQVLGILTPEMFELVMTKLLFSDSRFISLQETKWVIRGTLATSLNPEQLAFLDLVLYHKEDELLLH